MYINDNLKLATLTILDLPTGGSIGTASTTVDIASTFNIEQTTAGQVLTIPSPTDTTAGDRVVINNIGTVSFNIGGQSIAIDSSRQFVWNGLDWVFDSSSARNTGAVVTLASMTAGNNTVTHNLDMPTGSFSNLIVKAIDENGSEMTFRRVVASDTADTITVSVASAVSNPITFYITPLA